MATSTITAEENAIGASVVITSEVTEAGKRLSLQNPSDQDKKKFGNSEFQVIEESMIDEKVMMQTIKIHEDGKKDAKAKPAETKPEPAKNKTQESKKEEPKKEEQKKEESKKEEPKKEEPKKEEDKPKKAGWFGGIFGSKQEKEKEKFEINLLKTGDLSEPQKEKAVNVFFLGETGTGKTTAVNSFGHFLQGISYHQPTRFRVFEEKTGMSQVHSQTKQIGYHFVKGGKPEHLYRLIDTPGFGDTDDPDMDRTVVDLVQNCFETEIDQARVFCFVLKATMTRLTTSQQFVFSKVFELFGKDVETHIVFLLTWADSPNPPALKILKEMKFFNASRVFCINNGSVYTNPQTDKDTELTKKMYDLTKENYEKLFAMINKTPDVSLGMTKNVLRQRKFLSSEVDKFSEAIQISLSKINSLTRNIENLVEAEDQIELNKNYEIEYQVDDIIQINTDKIMTNCPVCLYNCHINCAYVKDSDKDKCIAIKNEMCTKCPKKCHWSVHRNLNKIFKIEKRIEMKKLQDLGDKYNKAKDDCSRIEEICKDYVIDLYNMFQEGFSHINNIVNTINELSKMALQPSNLEAYEHIAAMIEKEKNEKRPDYEKRVSTLNAYAKQIENLRTISESEDDTVFFDFLKEKFNKEHYDKILSFVKSMFKKGKLSKEQLDMFETLK